MTNDPNPRSIPAVRRPHLVVGLLVFTLLGVVTASGLSVGQTPQPTVQVSGGTVTETGTTNVDIVLTSAPDGLAGYYLELSVEDVDVARIVDARYPDRFGMTTDPTLGENGQTVTLEAVDLRESIQPGAEAVQLASVEVDGVAPGETRFSVDPIQFDADGGGAYEPGAEADVVTVTPGDDGGGDAARSDDQSSSELEGTANGADSRQIVPGGDSIGPSMIVLVGAAALILVAGLVLGRRSG